MLTRMIAAAVLVLTAAPAFASDASFDQRYPAMTSLPKEAQPRPTPCSCVCLHR